MQRDKRGRFVKKAYDGTILTVNNFKWKVKQGAKQAYDTFIAGGGTGDFQTWAMGSGIKYLEPATSFSEQTYGISPSLSLNQPLKLKTFPKDDPLGTKARQDQINSLDTFHMMYGDDADYSRIGAPEKIQYTKNDKGEYVDLNGNPINLMDLTTNPHRYSLKLPGFEETTSEEPSAGMDVTETDVHDNNSKFVFDRNKAADFLEYTRAGIGAHVNNKIAERALENEKPLLQDTSETHHNIYGDYRAKVRGEQAAAQLRNAAAKPLTSDGALQQQMMLEAQIKGQEYIDSGNAADEAVTKQTREIAWQQEKENQQQRQAVAMANRQAMLMSQKNKSQIENMRDSANFSQVLSPLLAAQEQRLRNRGQEQEAYQEYYDNALMSNQVWNDQSLELSPTQKQLRDKYLNNTITDEELSSPDFQHLSQIVKIETLKRQAALRGVTINPQSLNNSPAYGIFGGNVSMFGKKGGTIYKAKLSKRTKDNDRAAKSIESSKKIAARFLEKALDSLYTYDNVELIAKPKKKKRKYQSGGGLPFVNFTPIFASSEKGAPATSESSKSDNDLTSKDILELLKDMDGLPSDMQVIVQALRNFEMSDSLDPLGISASSNIASRYIGLINKIKVAKFNKSEYEAAFDQLKGNGGLNEYAITSEGFLIGTNREGDFEYFTTEDVKNGKLAEEGYQLLTNSNLLHLRANSTDAAFNHKLTTVAQNGIGMPSIQTLIQTAISNLGTTTNSQEGYIKSGQGDLIKGLEDFYQALQASEGRYSGNISDLYKYKYLTKSQAEQAKKAIQYIYQTLPNNAKTLLKMKSDGSDQGALEIIETLIASKENPQVSLDMSLVGGKTAKSTSGGNDNSDLKTSLPLNVLKNIGGQDSYIDIDRGDGIHMSLRGTAFNQVKTPNGEPIIDTSLLQMLGMSGLQSIVADMRNIQFGDQVISPEALAYITYNNTGVTRVNLPVKAGNKVNLDLLEKYEQAEQELDMMADKSKEAVQQVYEKYGLLELLNADGSYNQSKFAPFMVTEGYTTDALSGVKTSEFVKEFQGNEDAAIQIMEKSLQTGTGKNITKPNIDAHQWYNPADWFGWTDKIYKGVVYIPITNNVNTAVFGANQSLDYDEALGQEEKYQNFEKMSHQRSTDSSVLNI